MPVNQEQFESQTPPWQQQWIKASPWLGLLIVLGTLTLYAAIPHFHERNHATMSIAALNFLAERHSDFRHLIVFFGVLFAGLTLQPWCQYIAEKLRPRWQPLYTVFVFVGVCVLFSIASIDIGRHQFGGFDYNAMLEVGWRQVLGQRMYVDFLTPTPPGFNLGIKYAMSVFGANWDANLYLNCIFGCITLVWTYALLRFLEVGRPVALMIAVALECEGVLLLSFWWYNDTALVLSTIFLLTCLAYEKRPASTLVAVSYLASFVLLALMKPNIAGLTLLGGVALLFLGTNNRVRLLMLSIAALALIALVFLVNRISISAMISIYREVAKERGGLSLFGLHQMDKLARKIAVVAFAVLTLPGLWLLPQLRERLRNHQWHLAAPLLYFPLALLLSVYGLMSNGEFWQVECGPLLAVLAVLVFSRYRASYKNWMRYVLLALICADMASNIFIGFARLRVLTVGPGEFFEWTDNSHLIQAGPLRNMRVSGTMISVQNQIEAAVLANKGSYYFGPRVDYNYFALGLPSPKNSPAWWAPGTSFGRQQVPLLIHRWREQRFNTLIFLRGDYTFYPPEFMKVIKDDYQRDDTYSCLTVYHRR